ncbi:LysR family transcriptional regulator [Rhodoferax saidenbachensis]|uniref:LysR family transcriptional regulator n=1 Tax=Rhodoferax saidenbachensis TaxID=1484693 RepID=A0A1P8K677_9BURK|nr:LysR family transcriptional regulator [Rhodoferax saidenbachensis]APW41496.1 LysR family transcriptional regulator [Rhodoferax saidenbachensis]
MQLQLDDVALFTRIAELGTLSAAARERDVPVSQVTRSLARLEAACGVRLLHRTTHGLSLTDEGDTFLAYGRRLLDTTAELGSELTGKTSGPSGWVRISVSPVIAEMFIAPSLDGLSTRHPQIHVDINADDRMVDMARDGIDIAIRTGQPTQDTLVARQIGQFGRTLVASPGYLQRHGTPHTLADLDSHRLITNSVNPQINRWPLRQGGFYLARGTTRTDNSAILMALARAGSGMGRVMDAVAAPLIRSGELVAVMDDVLDPQTVPIVAVMLQERHRLPKIRACIDYWAEWITAQTAPPSGMTHG